MLNPATSTAGGVKGRFLLAALSGALLGLAFPPFGYAWLAWVGLVPLLWAIGQEQRSLHAFLAGLLGGTIFYLIVTRPLVSAHLWAGWEATPIEMLEGRLTAQSVTLNVLWVVLSVWCGLFWGLFALLLSRLAGSSLMRLAILAPPLFILLTEWLRSETAWKAQWAFLGNATVDLAAILQLGALGGVWLLSWLVVLVNVGVLALIRIDRNPRSWRLPVSVAVLVVVVVAGGSWRAHSVESRMSENSGLTVAALQYHQSRYTFADYTELGIEKAYLELMRQVARGDAGEVDLLVLPESISYSVLSLDGSITPVKPEEVHRSPEQWMESMAWVIGHNESRFSVILGLDTVERGRFHNSLVAWTDAGIEGRYHKRRLVPFSEYQPAVLGLVGLRGGVYYEAGRESQIAEIHGVNIGGFICQEVLTPGLLRRAVLDGAQLLVSGGNDGVFASPAVADIHADVVRLRAVETGRYIVRAMKTGISAIIGPSGRVVRRSPSSEPFVVVERVRPMGGLTVYTRFGDWPVALAVLVVLAGVLAWLRENARPAGKSDSQD